MAVPMPMTITEWEAAAIANSQALDALAEREVHRGAGQAERQPLQIPKRGFTTLANLDPKV